MTKVRLRFLASLSCMIFATSTAHSQLHYGSTYPGGALEYSLPFLTSVPPLYTGQPTDVATAYLWVDELLRGSDAGQINRYIWGLHYGDTLKFLAKVLYSVIDDNPLSYIQWNASTVQELGRPPLPWLYKANPDQERVQLQNQIGAQFSDSGRTGFLLACDIISDVTVSDTVIPVSNVPRMVRVSARINDEIKGKRIATCPPALRMKGKREEPLSVPASIYQTSADTASAGSCLQFEYSPDWQRGLFNDAQDFSTPVLADSTGWWIRPAGEYIVFLYLHGVNLDSSNDYFTVDPFLGVFGTQGAMYRVIGGHVVDPYDDFGLGGTNLIVADWKTRLRARIYNILNP